MPQRQIVRTCAAAMHIAPSVLIRRIVQAHHFSNEEEVVKQNLNRFWCPNTHPLPDYLVRYCERKLSSLGIKVSRAA